MEHQPVGQSSQQGNWPLNYCFTFSFSHFLAWWSTCLCQIRYYAAMLFTAKIRLMSAVQQIRTECGEEWAVSSEQRMDEKMPNQTKPYRIHPNHAQIISYKFQIITNLLRCRRRRRHRRRPSLQGIPQLTAGKIEFITPYRMHKLFKLKSTRFYCDK